MRVVAYLRVSTVGQVKDGLGLPTQERMIRAWVKANGHKLVGIEKENGKSGTLPESERPGLLNALSSLRMHGGKRVADAIVVTSLDRLARNLHVQEAILGKAWALDGRVFSVDGGEVLRDDPDDPMRTAMRQMAGVFAQLDRAMITKRLRNGRITKKQQGGYAGGRPPFGWKAEAGALVVDAKEQATLKRIRQLQKNRTSLRKMVAILEAEGHRPRAAKRWSAQTLSQVLKSAQEQPSSGRTRQRRSGQ
jgi:DNA invertase Pin-like site-specific DNA recombinase